MEFTITAHNGDSVKVEAENWMSAMGKAMAFFQVDIYDLGKLVCNPAMDGSIFVDNPTSERSWMVRRIEPKITVVAAAASVPLEVDQAPPETMEEPIPTAELATSSSPPPLLQMPVTSSLHKHVEEKETLAERLFDVSMDLSLATPEEACRLVIELLVEHVPAEVVSVAYGTMNDSALKVLAATGPIADAVIGGAVPFGEGLVGQCLEIGGTLLANDVDGETRHLDRVHHETGFKARAALCVPIVDGDGMSYGVIQLLNPTAGTFEADAIESVEAVARTLGASFAEQSD